MAKKLWFMGMVAVVLTFTVVVIGCNNDPDGKTTDLLVGTWDGINAWMAFSKDGTYRDSLQMTARFSVSGNTYTLSEINGGTYSVTHTFSFSNNNNTLTVYGYSTITWNRRR
ncbi:MAG: hypothetical protein FWD91_08260 [Treponema sp.]|nr:hypothetical protein [Treponema sp.]